MKSKYPNIHIFLRKKIEKKSFDQWNLDIYGMSWDKSYFANGLFKVSLDKSRINILMLILRNDIGNIADYIKMNSEVGLITIALRAYYLKTDKWQKSLLCRMSWKLLVLKK